MTNKIIKAGTWAIVGQFTKLVVKFGVSIILARLLSPKEFGLMGMVSVLIVLLNSMSELGLFTSLIQKKEVNQTELSSVFWLTFILGLVISLLLFISAPWVALFYNQNELTKIIQVLSIIFFFNSLVLTHNAILTKVLNFKILEIYSTVSLVLSSIIALILAYFNFGVWALVYQQILNSLFNAVIVWYFQSWRPSFILHFKSIKSLLGFGFRVFISGLLNTLFGSIDTIIIGKFFSAASLGLYSFAQNLINVTVGTFTTAIVRVLFPVMAGAQNDAERLKSIYLKTNNLLNIFIIPVMGTICIFANQIVAIFLGNKWLDMVVYFQLFAIIGILYPISALNINLILAKGRSDKFLHLEIIKKILLVIGIAVGFQFGIVGILFGILGISLNGVLFNLYYAGNVSGYFLKNQLIDMVPVLALSGIYLIILYVSKLFFIPFTNNILGSILSILLSVGIFYILIKKYKKDIIDDIGLIVNGYNPKKNNQ